MISSGEAFGQGRHVLFGLETGRQLNWPPKEPLLVSVFPCFLPRRQRDRFFTESQSLLLSSVIFVFLPFILCHILQFVYT